MSGDPVHSHKKCAWCREYKHGYLFRSITNSIDAIPEIAYANFWCVIPAPRSGMEEVMDCCGQEETRKKQRNADEKKDLANRLNRIEGQVRGVKAMVEEDRYCVDIVTQVSAICAALNSFNKELLARHIKTCVAKDIKDGREEAVDELCELLKKLMK